MYGHINISNIDILNVKFSDAVPYNANDLPLIGMRDKEVLLLIIFLNFLLVVVIFQ